ncbi:PGPGW domain-containing protein [Sulfurovum sp. ST-21]|uniref:Transmembrane protein (PGPGW) n=1 Tax=Sulfurovum indicum TaxID=2779528 RepID=A0A7M1S252_9BACT|nr:PGPGW domain-containing protein [Sulfurovum indicum]QOR61523.1 hypothetical protein IMZ28_08775 [Sulfurovum indicum]
MFVTIAAMTGFVLSIVLVPWIIVQIPSDYFSYPQRQKYLWSGWHPLIRMIAIIMKNMLGFIFVAAGIAMLVLPGQGLLTILVGLFLIEFPYKYKVERWLIKRPFIFKAANWIRRKANRSPLKI